MKKIVIRKLSLFIVIALLFVQLLCLFSCSNNKKNDNTITIWAYDTTAIAAQKAVEIYKAQNPNCGYDFEVIGYGQEDMVEKIKMGLLSESLDLLPDIFYDEDYNFNEYLTYYQDSFYNLSDYLSKDDFYDFKFINSLYGDSMYSIPYDAGTGMLLYRLDLLEKAGFKEGDLDNLTWTEFISIGKTVKEKTGMDMIIMCPDGDMEGRLLYQSAGSWFFDANGDVNIQNNNVFIDAFNTIKQAYDAGIVYDAIGWDDYINAIANGKMVSLIGASWWIPIITEYTEQSGLWRITTMPRMEGDSHYSNYSNLGGGGWFVINNEKSEIASKFAVEMFAKNIDLANYMANEYFFLPVCKDLAANITLMPSEFFGNQECAKIIASYNEKVIPVKYGINNYEVTYTIGPVVGEYVHGKVSIETALSNIQKKCIENDYK